MVIELILCQYTSPLIILPEFEKCHCYFVVKKLTAKMERNLALCVATDADLRDLGTYGFEVKERVIDAAIRNHKTISDAATEVIKQWVREKEDKEKAYEDLVAILRKIKRGSWINELED